MVKLVVNLVVKLNMRTHGMQKGASRRVGDGEDLSAALRLIVVPPVSTSASLQRWHAIFNTLPYSMGFI